VSEQGLEKKRDFLPIIIVGVILAALFGISLYIRLALPHDQIFVNGGVWFRETDAYYYMRNIENLVHNFPHFNVSDPYALYPGGGAGLTRPFFAWLVAGAILLFKGASASLQSMEAVAAYMPLSQPRWLSSCLANSSIALCSASPTIISLKFCSAPPACSF